MELFPSQLGLIAIIVALLLLLLHAAWGDFTHHPDKANDNDDDDDDYEDTVEEAYDAPLVLFEQQAEFNDNDGANDVQEDLSPPGKLFYRHFIQPLSRRRTDSSWYST